MQITLEIPEQLAAGILRAGKDPAHVALEALAIEGYRTRHLNESQVRRMLGYGTRMQVHALLATHNVPLNYTAEHLQQDIKASDALQAERRTQAVHAE